MQSKMQNSESLLATAGAAGMSEPQRPYKPPRGRRLLRLACVAKLFPGRRSSAVIVNVSVGGVAFETYAPTRLGSTVLLSVAGIGEIPAVVRWSAGNRFGACFNGRMGIFERQVVAKLVRMSLTSSSNNAEQVSTQEPEVKGLGQTSSSREDWEAELQNVHNRQLQLLDELEQMTTLEAPDASGLAALRLSLTRASRERRDLMNYKVLPHLRRLSSAKAERLVARVKARDEALQRLSANHIGHWSLHAALRDWRGYCDASTKMRNAIRAQIAAEQEAVFLTRR